MKGGPLQTPKQKVLRAACNALEKGFKVVNVVKPKKNTILKKGWG